MVNKNAPEDVIQRGADAGFVQAASQHGLQPGRIATNKLPKGTLAIHRDDVRVSIILTCANIIDARALYAKFSEEANSGMIMIDVPKKGRE